MTTLWWRNPDGTATVTVSQPEPRTDAAPTRYDVLDRDDRQAMADWRAGTHRVYPVADDAQIWVARSWEFDDERIVSTPMSTKAEAVEWIGVGLDQVDAYPTVTTVGEYRRSPGHHDEGALAAAALGFVPPVDPVCAECGWTYTGTYCDVCTPCDDCGRAPAACGCTSHSVDPLD